MPKKFEEPMPEEKSEQEQAGDQYKEILEKQIRYELRNGEGLISFNKLKEGLNLIPFTMDNEKEIEKRFSELWGAGDTPKHSVYMKAVSNLESGYRQNNMIGAEDLVEQASDLNSDLARILGVDKAKQFEGDFREKWIIVVRRAAKDQKNSGGEDLQDLIDSSRRLIRALLDDKTDFTFAKGGKLNPKMLAVSELKEKRAILSEYIKKMSDELAKAES